MQDLAAQLLQACREESWSLVTAESCTGGLLAGALTEVPGSSDVFDRGYVTYSYAAKSADLGVDPELLARHGAVSSAVAAAMVDGAVTASDALFILAAAIALENCEPCICDVNDSGAITAADALAALQVAVGLDTELLCQPCI